MEAVKRGEVWLSNLNPSKGTQPGKIRPVLIIQTDLLNETHSSTIVLPITSQTAKGIEHLRVHLKPSKGNGLEKDSDVLIDQLLALDNKRLIQRLGNVTNSELDLIAANVAIVLDL